MPPKQLTQTVQAAIGGPAKDGMPATPAGRPHNYEYLTIPRGPNAPSPFSMHRALPATLSPDGDVTYPTMSDVHKAAALRMYDETGGNSKTSMIADGITTVISEVRMPPALERVEAPARSVVPRPTNSLRK